MWSDVESNEDYLNFGEVSSLAIDIISSPKMLPVSIGIFGNWGSGKSSMLNLIETQLKDSTDKNYIIVRFDAWLYQGYDDVRAALLETIASTLLEHADTSKVADKVRSLLTRVDKFRLFGLAAEAGAMLMGFPTFGVLSRASGALGDLADGVQDEKEQEGIKETSSEAVETAKTLIKDKESNSPSKHIDEFRKEYTDILETLDKPLVVMIDNLDRCLPTNAIHTLEAIRLFLFLPNTAFIIAADEEMIRGSVSDYFKGSTERHKIDYIDKLIQIPIRVPKAGIREIRAYLFMLYALDFGIDNSSQSRLRKGLEDALRNSWKDDPIDRADALRLIGNAIDTRLESNFEMVDRIAPLLATSPMIQGNPRTVKRLLNVIKLRSLIAQRRDMKLDEAIITKLVVFERCAGIDATNALYSFIDIEKGKPKFLKDLEEGVNQEEMPIDFKSSASLENFIKEWAQIEPKLSSLDLRPAVYLSRETIPLGVFTIGLSRLGKEAFEVLRQMNSVSSTVADQIFSSLNETEVIMVMESLIAELRQISEWNKRPKAFNGAYFLANKSSEAGKMLKRFLKDINQKEIWLETLLKNATWSKD